MPITVKFDLRGAQVVQQRIANLIQQLRGNRAALHTRYGIQALRWIDKNFQVEGGLLNAGPWKKLSDRTVAGRRKGPRKITTAEQRKKYGAKILQDTGRLRQSFTVQAGEDEVIVGSAVPYARYHEYGVAPYQVGARNRRTESSQRIFRDPGGGLRTIREQKIIPARREFTHPGLPQRRMLPTFDEIGPTLYRVTRNYLDEIAEGQVPNDAGGNVD